MTVISELQLWFEQQYIKVSVEWLQACLDWLSEENNNQHIPLPQLKESVYEQWLAADLQELGSSCLPSSVISSQKILLNGFFPLQVNAFKDVSQPAYSQLVKLKKIDNLNSFVSATPAAPVPYWEVKPKRMLMLNLTDGTHFLQGMEYRPISCLTADLPPGTKIMVMGPIECRLGVLLLTDEKVKLLGGDVDHLLKENDQHHVLTRALGQEVTSNSDGHQIAETENEPANNHRNISLPINIESNVASRQNLQSKIQGSLPVTTTVTQNAQNSHEFEELDDDDFLTQLDYAELDKIEQDNINEHSIEDEMIEDIDDDVLNEQMEFQYTAECEKLFFQGTTTEAAIHHSAEFRKKDDPNEELMPFVYLNHVLKTLNPARKTVATIKGFITTITSRLECNSDNWKLTAKINDGSAALEVDLHDKVLSGFIGIKAEEVMALKNKAQKDEEVKLRVMQAMQQCKQKLQDLNCLMDVEFSPTLPRPCIIKCHSLQKQHIEQLLKRLKKNSSLMLNS